MARIFELGTHGCSVVEIDRTLHRESYKTSTGTRWPAKNDGRVVVRLLINNGLTPIPGDARVRAAVAAAVVAAAALLLLRRRLHRATAGDVPLLP